MEDLFGEEEKGEESSVSVRVKGEIVGGTQAKAIRKTGRPPRQRELEVLTAINTAMPPARIIEAINHAYLLAIEHGSPKGIMQVVEFCVAYQLGEPVKRVVTQRSTVEELLSQASGVDDEEFDALIDTLYDEHSAR